MGLLLEFGGHLWDLGFYFWGRTGKSPGNLGYFFVDFQGLFCVILGLFFVGFRVFFLVGLVVFYGIWGLLMKFQWFLTGFWWRFY